MSKKQSKGEGKSTVRLYGPLGPWRFSIAVLVAALTTGMSLYRAAIAGAGLDMAFVRSFGVAFFTWIVLGSINKMLALADARGSAADALQEDVEDEPSTR